MEKETGTVKWFNEQRGYGYIERDSREGDIFVNRSDILGEGVKSLSEGDRVEFMVKEDPEGPAAGNVRKL